MSEEESEAPIAGEEEEEKDKVQPHENGTKTKKKKKKRTKAPPGPATVHDILWQHRRTDWVIFRAVRLTSSQLEEYLSELPHFSYVNKWVLCARLTHSQLESGVYVHLTKNLATLSHLDLSHNLLHGDDVKLLLATLALEQNTVLSVLKLAGNPLGNSGVVSLVKAVLNDVVTLHALDVSSCGIDDSACHELSYMLRGGRYAETFFLDLSKNRIGHVGTSVLGKGLPGKVSLSLCRNVPLPQSQPQKRSREQQQSV